MRIGEQSSFVVLVDREQRACHGSMRWPSVYRFLSIRDQSSRIHLNKYVGYSKRYGYKTEKQGPHRRME